VGGGHRAYILYTLYGGCVYGQSWPWHFLYYMCIGPMYYCTEEGQKTTSSCSFEVTNSKFRSINSEGLFLCDLTMSGWCRVKASPDVAFTTCIIVLKKAKRRPAHVLVLGWSSQVFDSLCSLYCYPAQDGQCVLFVTLPMFWVTKSGKWISGGPWLPAISFAEKITFQYSE
jgi:hypothetical protein